ncbi:MAG: RagB/SusD family nutrient uptake outer membrane protein [Bacteroidia bacterium]
MIAEAKFIRAIAHWYMVRLYGQPYGYTSDNSHLGIPLRLKYGRDIVNRSSVAEVYAQVISDLKDAAAVLPEDNGGYATRYAALAFLAKVHFQMNDFGNAWDYANQVISSNHFVFDSALNGRFARALTSESIFHLVSTPQDNTGGTLFYNWRVDPNTGLAGLSFSNEYVGAVSQNNDKRGQRWVLQSGDFNFSTKWKIPLA